MGKCNGTLFCGMFSCVGETVQLPESVLSISAKRDKYMIICSTLQTDNHTNIPVLSVPATFAEATGRPTSLCWQLTTKRIQNVMS